MHDDQPLAPDNSAPLVLLIDDAEDLRTVVSDFLQSSGFRVETAKNGFQGVTRAVESVPDIILMDLGHAGYGWLGDGPAPEEAEPHELRPDCGLYGSDARRRHGAGSGVWVY